MAAFPLSGWKQLNQFLVTHSALQAQFADQIGLPLGVSGALRQSYERWDGKGVPQGARGEGIALASRIVSLADVAEVHHRTGGVDAARESFASGVAASSIRRS